MVPGHWDFNKNDSRPPELRTPALGSPVANETVKSGEVSSWLSPGAGSEVALGISNPLLFLVYTARQAIP